MTYNKILVKWNFYFKAILHDFGKKKTTFPPNFWKELSWQIIVKQIYKMILESKIFTLKQYYMIFEKMQNFV